MIRLQKFRIRSFDIDANHFELRRPPPMDAADTDLSDKVLCQSHFRPCFEWKADSPLYEYVARGEYKGQGLELVLYHPPQRIELVLDGASIGITFKSRTPKVKMRSNAARWWRRRA
jgi:hypothetical protein